ncbi:MAG TPA: VWA domain-containing protein [Geminicoccaceae bacterium]|nr:VWA domain-containing protein [Geminicoccaceae bacterium]
MRFAAWPAVYLLALVPALLALYAYAFGRQRRALAAFVARDLSPRLLPPIAERRRWLRAGCLIGAVACLVIALMQPEWGRGATELPLRGRDVIVLLDVSHSMLAEDVLPSRLAQAKTAARSLALAVQQDGGHRLGLLTFAGRADVQCPLTRDYRLFLKRLEDATTDGVARRGTSIGEAVRQAVRAFGELEPGYTDLVLITDGEDHASLPLEAAQMLGALQLSLATVGIGDPNRSAPIPLAAEGGVSHLIHDGQEVRSRMRRGLLVGMADAAGGVYLGGEAGPARLDRWYADHVAPKPRRELEPATSAELAPRHQGFIVLAIALLLIELIMRSVGEAGVRRETAGQMRPRLLAGFVALLPILGADQAEIAVREGNTLYDAGQYEAALRQYEAAAEQLPGSAVVEFNRGNALFKNRDQEQALDRYMAALNTEDAELASRAKYNIGVIKYRQALAAAQRYEDALALTRAAIGYFRDSLRLSARRDDARYNLELAYRYHHRLEQELLHAQRNAETPGEKTSLRRGQAFSDKIRNEGSGQRDARADLDRRQHGQRANDVPEIFSNNEETSRPPQMARLPMAMSPDAAQQLMEQLRQRLEAAEIRRQEQRRRRVQQADEPTPW